jgi:hypothetical protein
MISRIQSPLVLVQLTNREQTGSAANRQEVIKINDYIYEVADNWSNISNELVQVKYLK